MRFNYSSKISTTYSIFTTNCAGGIFFVSFSYPKLIMKPLRKVLEEFYKVFYAVVFFKCYVQSSFTNSYVLFLSSVKEPNMIL